MSLRDAYDCDEAPLTITPPLLQETRNVLELHTLTLGSAQGERRTVERLRQLRTEALYSADVDVRARTELENLAKACTWLLRALGPA